MPAQSLNIDDPQSVPTYGDRPISRLITRWCQGALHDPRDEVFVRLTLRAIATQLAAMAALYLTLTHTSLPAWLPGLAYFALWGWCTPPIILMLHCTMHRKFIRSPEWLDLVHPFVMSFFFGMPMGFREHHIGMHHVEDNMPSDLSSTLRYRRDSFGHFLRYFGRFFFMVSFQLPQYLAAHKRKKMAQRAVVGELLQWSVVIGSMSLLDYRFGLIVFLLPLVFSRFSMMAGNWGQHAFINTDKPNNGIANAISCINTTYNKRCFNDGYHIGHHMRAKRHWAELPADFLANRELYAREEVVVFEGVDFFMVSVLLWVGAWNVLAKRYVRLGRDMSDAEVIAMLKARVQPVVAWPAAGLQTSTATA